MTKCSLVCRMVSLHIPDEYQRDVCTLRWWQPNHSGPDRDVWAVDDVSLTKQVCLLYYKRKIPQEREILNPLALIIAAMTLSGHAILNLFV